MSESHCMRFVTAASETRFRAGGGASSDGGLIVMAAWGCGAVMTSRCGEGLRLAPRGAAILVLALHTDQAKLGPRGAASFASQAARAAFRPTGQPLWYNYVVPTPLLQPGSPNAALAIPRRELCVPWTKQLIQ